MREIVTTTVRITHNTSTTQYTAKDVISAGTTVPMAFASTFMGGAVTKLMVKTNVAAFTGLVRLWLYAGTAPTFAIDNAAMNMLYSESYIGYIETSLEAWGTACSIGGATDNISFPPTTDGYIYGVLTVGAGASPTPTNGMLIDVSLTCENF